MKIQDALRPRIYVACLAAYNAGTLHGVWLDADQDATDIEEAVKVMLSKSPEPIAEEWAIHDFEGFAGIELGEWTPFEEASRLAHGIVEHGEAFGAYVEHVGSEQATDEGFQDMYRGYWESEEAFGTDLFDDLYAHEIPEHLRGYIDYDAFSRDLFMGDYFSVKSSDFGVFVFSSE